MKCNVSRTDKMVRLALSVGLVILGLALLSPVGILGLVVPVIVALILTSTVFLSWCPIYAIFGISTC